jgi:hypothetical protein
LPYEKSGGVGERGVDLHVGASPYGRAEVRLRRERRAIVVVVNCILRMEVCEGPVG